MESCLKGWPRPLQGSDPMPRYLFEPARRLPHPLALVALCRLGVRASAKPIVQRDRKGEGGHLIEETAVI